jgi:hypothetical protein
LYKNRRIIIIKNREKLKGESNMKKYFVFLIGLILLSGLNICFADDLTFDSFEEAEAAAKKRAAEYEKKMDEHLKQVQKDWEKQQKDLGESDASPDITKITTSSDGQKTSDSDASKNMEDAVTSSVNDLKDMMINSATPNTTGFAGGGAGYQWSVKYKNGKYVLSDSYNEAAFGTGDKRDKDPEPAKEISGGDDDSDTVVATKPEPEAPATTPAPPEEPEKPAAPATKPASPATSEPAVATKPDSTPPSKGEPATSGASPATPTKTPEKPAPGIDPAPTKLPEPAVRMVIQHPTDFSEEVFSSNADANEPVEYKLDKFKIPEDTRVKIALEISKEVDPKNISLVITDDEGERAPVDSSKLKNFRHLFRVPSDDKYSAAVILDDKSSPGSGKKQLMKVRIPVVKVDFDSRTIDEQRQRRGSGDSTSGTTTSSSPGTTYSSSDSNYTHSSFGKPQQVDLSDLYSEPGSSSGNNTGSNQYASTAGGSASSGSGSNSQGSYGYYTSGNSAGSSSSSSADYSSSAGYNSTGSPGASAANSGAGSNSSYDQNPAGNGEYSDESTDAYSTGQYSENEDGMSGGANFGSGSDGSASSTDAQSGDNDSYASGNSGADSGSYGDSQQGSGNENSDSDDYDNSSENAAGDMRNQATGQNGSEQGLDGSQVAMANLDGTNASQPGQDNDPFVMAISMQAVSKNIYQSFDFLEEPSPVTATIPAGTEVTFSMSFANDVIPESVKIELNDGKGVVNGDLKTWGEAFAYVFEKPSQAYFQISGKTANKNFSYRLQIPVK